jgi:hypothetical protein
VSAVHVSDQALEIANAWRAAALPVGIGLMMLVVLLDPTLKPLGNLNLLIFFVLIVGDLVFAAVPALTRAALRPA